MPPPLSNTVINPPQLSSVCQQSSISSHNTTRYNQYFNIKDSNSNSNDLLLPVIPVPNPLNYLVVNTPQLFSVTKQPSSSSHNTTHESKASSISVWISPYPSDTMPPPSTNNGIHHIYGYMVDVSKLTLAQLQHHSVMIIQHYHELCNTNDPSSMIVSPPPIPKI